jgi:RNA polymerase sigma-B factor
MAPQRPSPAERHRAECERLSLAERDRLVLDFMPLARRVAHRYAAPLQREDLEQVAFLALVKAAERYDPAHRTSFPAYAIPTIVGEIKHFLRDHTWDLHVPRQVQERALLVTRASDELAGRLGRAPTIRELAEQLALSTSDVLEALEAAAARDARSLDAPVERADGEGADTAAMGLMGHEDLGLELALERADLRRALARLSPEQREVIVLRFFADLTQSQIARRVGVSQMQVSRILRRALAAMREFAGLQEPDAATINRPGG